MGNDLAFILVGLMLGVYATWAIMRESARRQGNEITALKMRAAELSTTVGSYDRLVRTLEQRVDDWRLLSIEAQERIVQLVAAAMPAPVAASDEVILDPPTIAAADRLALEEDRQEQLRVRDRRLELEGMEALLLDDPEAPPLRRMAPDKDPDDDTSFASRMVD